MKKISAHEAWVNIFEHYDLLAVIARDNFADITADQIKAVDGKEARLMCKVDFREHLSPIFKDNELSILAIHNGVYRIAHNDPFIDINEQILTPIITLDAPTSITSIDPFNIKSESAALDLAYIANMCTHVFKEETQLCVRGRLRGELSFSLENINYGIDGVQIEVDGGYEGETALHLIEAKIGYRNNINIRQLLYPELVWKNRVSKKVKSYIFYLHNDVFRFIPYVYDGDVGYADHENECAFRFKHSDDGFDLYTIKPLDRVVNTYMPFPQADKFEKVLDILYVLCKHERLSKHELSLEFDLVARQIDYYVNVLKWLRLCDERFGYIIVSELGMACNVLGFKQRVKMLAKRVFSERIFYNTLHELAVSDHDFKRYRVNSKSTQMRRLQTVSSWILFFKKVLEK